MQSISDKLKALGVSRGTDSITSSKQLKTVSFPIEEILDGTWETTRKGEIYTVTKRYPKDTRHGIVSLNQSIDLAPIAAYAKDKRIEQCSMEEIAFLDTETTGLSGGTGTYSFLIGIGRYKNDCFEFKQFFLQNPSEETVQLEAVGAYLAPCKAIATYNGKSFDVPLLNNRYTLNTTPSPFSELSHIDLYHLSRRLWKRRLASCTLNAVEKHVIRINRTDDDIPGWMIPDIYWNYLQDQDARPLKNIFYHNEIDVVSLAALLIHIANLLHAPIDNAADQPEDLLSIAKLHADIGNLENAAECYHHGLCSDNLPEKHWLESIKELSFLHKKRGELDDAMQLWEKAASKGEIYACIELAKVFEHRYRRYALAKEWTLTAIGLAGSPEFPQYKRILLLPELEHRLNRLQRKMEKYHGQ